VGWRGGGAVLLLSASLSEMERRRCCTPPLSLIKWNGEEEVLYSSSQPH